MTFTRSRNRLVVFRVTGEEYEKLELACLQKGARSLSDFTRLAVFRSAEIEEREEESLHRRLLNLGDTLTELESRIKKLLRLIERVSSQNDSQKPAAR